MRRLVLMISLLVAGAGMLLAGALPAVAAPVAPAVTFVGAALTSAPNPSVVGQTVTFTYTAGVPTRNATSRQCRVRLC